MTKNFLRILVILFFIFGIFWGVKFIKKEYFDQSNIDENLLVQKTIDLSRFYVNLRLKTENLLLNAQSYSNYENWYQECSNIIKEWENLEIEAKNLEQYIPNNKLSFNFISEVYAEEKSEITAIYDNAKAGQKIKTLAKYLGVDAKTAFKILQNDQDFVKADAWNKAGDTFQKLENSAIVLKDTCKITAYLGTTLATGGSSSAIASAGQATVVAVAGTDLILELTEDGATIALGDSDKTTKYISKIRSDSYLEPTASILSLSNLADANKPEIILMHAETLRSALQDKKILGIKLSNIQEDKIELTALDNNSNLKDWFKSINKNYKEKTNEELELWLNQFNEKIIEDNDVSILIDPVKKNDITDRFDGVYKGILKLDDYSLPITLKVENGKVTTQVIMSSDGDFFDHQIKVSLNIKLSGYVFKDASAYGKSKGTIDLVMNQGEHKVIPVSGDFSAVFTSNTVSLEYKPIVPDAETDILRVKLEKE